MGKEIIEAEGFLEELKELMKQRVPKKRREKVAKKYISLLETIREQRKEVITLPYFEKLKGTRSMDLYCLRLVKKSPNIRIIFTFIGSYVVLLTAFEEREESDYKKAIESAVNRYRDLLREGLI